jgi:FtsZ-binding cell division protein ZapB
MENYDKFVEFLHTSFPNKSNKSEWFCNMSQFTFSKISGISQWWHKCVNDFCSGSGTSNSNGYTLFSFLKSCEYTDHAITLKTQELSTENQKLKSTIHELSVENQELKSLIYGMLDEINDLKEHNKSLSQRIDALENKPPIVHY